MNLNLNCFSIYHKINIGDQSINSTIYHYFKQVLSDTKRLLSSEGLQPSDYAQAVDNMIGAIYAVYLVEQKYKKPTSSTAIINTSINDVIDLFPDFNKRLHDIGIERH